MSDNKMSGAEVLDDLHHVHDIYGIDLSNAIRAVASMIERDAAQDKRIADLADCLERASDTLKYAYGSTCGNLHSEVNKTLNYLLSRAEARNG